MLTAYLSVRGFGAGDIRASPAGLRRSRLGYRTSNPQGAAGSAERGNVSGRTEAHEGTVGSRWAVAFFVLLALTPNVPYVKISAVGLALNDFPPILAVLCGLIAVAARYRRGQSLPVPVVALLLGQIALIAGVSTVAHGLRFDDLLGGPIRWTEITLIVALAFILGDDAQLLWLFLRVAVIAAAADALFGIGAFVTGFVGPNYIGIEPFPPYQALYGVFPGRITGTLGIPSNGSGVLFALALPIAVAYALGAKERATRFRWLVVAATLAVALLFTFSRVPLVIGVGMVVVLLGVQLRPSVAFSAAAFFAFVVVATPIRDRFAGDQNNRLSLWTTAINMTRDNPLLGVGPDSYNLALPRYAATQFGVAPTTAHNSILEASASMGIFAGVLLTLAIAGTLLWLPTAMRLRRSRPELLGAWLGLFGFVVASMTVNFFFWPQLGLFYWTMAVALLRGAPLIERRLAAARPEIPAHAVPVHVRRAVSLGRGAG